MSPQKSFEWLPDDVIYHFTDKELDDAVKKLWIAKAAATIISQWIVIEKIKRELDSKTKQNWLPKELHDFINSRRAKHLFRMEWVSFQVSKEDRLGENIDNLCANLHPEASYEGWPLKYLQIISEKYFKDNSPLGDFIMRTPEDYLKVLIYQLGLTCIEELERFFQAFEENKEQLSASSEWFFKRWSFYYYHLEHSFEKPVEFLATNLSPARLYRILDIFNIKNIDDFITLFIKTPWMYPLFMGVDLHLLVYFTEANQINTIEKCVHFFWWNLDKWKETDIKKVLIRISELWEKAIENTLFLLKYFWIHTVESLNILDINIAKILSASSQENIWHLLWLYGARNLEEVKSCLLHPYISSNIEQVDYGNFIEVLQTIGISKVEQPSIAKKIIENWYDKDTSDILKKLKITLEKFKWNLGNIWIYILYLLKERKDIWWNVWELIKTIESLENVLSHSGTSAYIDFSRLIKLSEFMGWYITSYLAQKILETSDTEWLLQSWEETIQDYKRGNFDRENELHINLEYKYFKQISQDENIAQHMWNKFTFTEYSYIFRKNPRGEIDFRDVDNYELECVAYEASLLKQYIFQVSEKAKRLWRKLLIIPNLTYGYLPLSAIIQELEGKDNIEICIWPKVGSTESHSNMEVLNRSLFRWKRTDIVNSQPMILVIDGTRHLISRDEGNKSARYPDAYQGYLNQVIAINYALWFTDPKKLENTYIWKSEGDLVRLFATEEFKRTSEIYRSLLEQSSGKMYTFWLWNTAWYPLIIRWYRREIPISVQPIEASNLNNPTLIFCNVGVLHEDLPKHLQSSRYKHVPAHFDDSGRIICFEYWYSSTGIQFVNSIETHLQNLQNKKGASQMPHPALLKHRVPVTHED